MQAPTSLETTPSLVGGEVACDVACLTSDGVAAWSGGIPTFGHLASPDARPTVSLELDLGDLVDYEEGCFPTPSYPVDAGIAILYRCH